MPHIKHNMIVPQDGKTGFQFAMSKFYGAYKYINQQYNRNENSFSLEMSIKISKVLDVLVHDMLCISKHAISCNKEITLHLAALKDLGKVTCTAICNLINTYPRYFNAKKIPIK